MRRLQDKRDLLEYKANWVVVDCEGDGSGKGSPSVGSMGPFGAVHVATKKTFYGEGPTKQEFDRFAQWLRVTCLGRPVFWSDNPAYDWQWINFYFWKFHGRNPFGHSARRIGDFYAGLVGDVTASSEWKKLRVTKHDHNPVNDAMGNVEALQRMLDGERA